MFNKFKFEWWPWVCIAMQKNIFTIYLLFDNLFFIVIPFTNTPLTFIPVVLPSPFPGRSGHRDSQAVKTSPYNLFCLSDTFNYRVRGLTPGRHKARRVTAAWPRSGTWLQGDLRCVRAVFGHTSYIYRKIEIESVLKYED